ncbi:AaceriACL192Cp [[Ashbya] aceris (nom. inval.)]|nr:AaceriACL192Cp [[Ashbya] aceris (nom. inval.)]
MGEAYAGKKQLPPEIVYEILSYQFRDLMSNDHPPSSEKYHNNLRMFLRSNATVNKTFNHVCRVLTYRYLNFTTARCFNRMLEVLKHDKTGLSGLVQVADFQELTSIGLGRTGEMNRIIKNLTNETLLEFLQLTAHSLREFLASEHIQGDLDEQVIYHLVRPGSLLNVLDFCGCSGPSFTETFVRVIDRLYEADSDEPRDQNYQLTSVGLNDCTDLPALTLGRFLKAQPELQKLDLSHTSIDDHTLLHSLPHWKNLTHLSFADCSQLTPRAILEFFSYHPAITDENNTTLQWLNLKAHKHTSSWTETQTMFLLKKLCRYGHNNTLQYLNIDGLPLHYSEDNKITKTPYYYQCQDTLKFIKWNFPKLKSLSIRKASVPIPSLVKLLSSFDSYEEETIEDMSPSSPRSAPFEGSLPVPSQQLKFLDVAGNSYINKWTINDPALFTCSESLVALEVSFECWQQIESRANSEVVFMRPKSPNTSRSSIIQDYSRVEEVKWKCYIDASYGRRYWLFRTDDYLNGDDLDARGSITRYDSEGNRIIDITKQPDFLKFAQNKIMLGCGIVPLNSVRRHNTYRDTKPPISRFFKKDGKLTMGGSRTLPIRSPRLPPGAWRLMNNETTSSRDMDLDEAPDSAASNNYQLSPGGVELSFSRQEPLRRSGTRDGLYWDRSVTDLHLLATTEPTITGRPDSLVTIGSNQASAGADEYDTSYDYLNNPELQRRRSQFSLFRYRPTSIPNENAAPRPSLLTKTFKNHALMARGLPAQYCNMYPYRDLLRDSCIYYSPSAETNERYRKHLEMVQEYEVFGCLERGMYRYYSLRT